MKYGTLLAALLFSLFLFSTPKSTDYARHLELSFLFYEAQRSGPLPKTNRIWWRHDSMTDAGYDVDVDLTGGYYDAGDNVKFNYPGAGALTLIAWSGIEFAEGYKKCGQWEYMLDMVKWGADYFIKCHPSKEELYIAVGKGNVDHGFWYPPEFIDYEHPAYKVDAKHPGSEVAGETAASLAAASILFKEEDTAYSQSLLKHAIEIFDFADKYRGDYTTSVPEMAAFYGTSKTGYYDELVWAALWLYRATEDEKYLEKFEKIKQEDKNYANCNIPMNWADKYPGAYALAAQLLDDDQYMDEAIKYCDTILASKTTPGGLYYHPTLSKWGSNRYAANAASILAFVAKLLPEKDEKREKYINYVQKQINYILGDNPLKINYVVGAEENSPKCVHHRAASNTYDSNAKPPFNIYTLYGALAGGPGPDDEYTDERSNYEMNEVAIDYNSGFTVDLAALVYFGLGKKDTGKILEFDRAWPCKAPTPDIRLEMDSGSFSISTGSGMMCASWCITFAAEFVIKKMSAYAVFLNEDPEKYIICNSLENGFLDGEGTARKIKYRLENETDFAVPEEFEVLCDGYHSVPSWSKGENTYRPEYGHAYKVTGNGGVNGTEPLFEKSECWPAHICKESKDKE